ncbi:MULTISPECIES: ABC transporter permease [Paraburkholderia]|uniref:ABC transporter permease subunit n=1 Tax=Paraburkholderia podalyriae TaxID=1938811 RepID=A0ABR7PZZ4_9BURK|nr:MULTISPECIES: ABC transporter permease subunit [Paraburkholderia]MBC8751860.1 ABC transporter permease subunit [Paraburkholderia podalyriae]MDH6152573.1 octopine/nopaline transport system permease protein [Paraburkholderia sp. WSM4179]
MDLSFIYQTFLQLLPGIPLTVGLAALSVVLGGLLGFGIALLRMSPWAPARGFAWLYVLLFRSVPLLVLLFMIYYGLSQFDAIRESFLWPILRQPHWCALIALIINDSPYSSEIIRGGLRSVRRGELEAAYACGMSGPLLMRRIVIPIAIRQALPAYGNEIIAMVKATSLASLVTLMDVTGIASSIANDTYRPVEVYVSAGVIYLIISYLLTRGVQWTERRLNPHLRPPVIQPDSFVEGKTI